MTAHAMNACPSSTRSFLLLLAALTVTLGLSACASSSSMSGGDDMAADDDDDQSIPELYASAAPDPDPRVGLGAGVFDAEEATWNLNVLSSPRPPEQFVGQTNSDLAC